MNNYDDLRAYYAQCFSEIDVFHFNSSISESVFNDYNNDLTGKIIPISHYGIKDNRERKKFNNDCLKIGFIGSLAPYKGYPTLYKVLQDINKEQDWRLDVWGNKVGTDTMLPIFFRGKFSSNDLSSIFYDMDVLVVPSIWKETFGFVVLEALSYGTPVIVSDYVGAQDLVKEYDDRFIYHSDNELRELLEELLDNRTALIEFNHKLCSSKWNHSMISHTKDIIEKIYGV